MDNANKLEDRQSVLDNLGAKLSSYLIGQETSIAKIESKLHKILSRNIEKPKGGQSEDSLVSTPIDFATKMSEHLNKISLNNARLQEIEQHLSEII